MWINGIDIADYGGQLRMEYKTSGYQLDTAAFKGRNRSSFVLLTSTTGFMTITLPVVFEGADRDDVTRKKSLFDMLIFGKNELLMDDGFQYAAYLSAIGDSSYPAPELIEVEYTLIGVRHGDKVTVTGNTVACDSTLPDTDCILSCTVGTSGAGYKVGSVTFKSVTAGQRLVVDGINKRILVDGVPAAENAEWIRFPSLKPGLNNLECSDTLTVEFYPVYF